METENVLIKAVKVEVNPCWELFLSCFLSHLLYGICEKIFIMNRYI